MAGTLYLQHFAPSGGHVYAYVFNTNGLAYQPSSLSFVGYVQASGSRYAINLMEVTGHHRAYSGSTNLNAGIGEYTVEIFKAATSGVYNRETDRLIGTNTLAWNGSKEITLLDIGSGTINNTIYVSGISDDISRVLQEIYSLRKQL